MVESHHTILMPCAYLLILACTVAVVVGNHATCLGVNICVSLRLVWIIVAALWHARRELNDPLQCNMQDDVRCKVWRHIVILPVYQERRETLRKVLESLKAQTTRPTWVVLSFEDAGPPRDDDMNFIKEAYGEYFTLKFYTHKLDHMKELRGRGANFRFAALKLQSDFLSGLQKEGDDDAMAMTVADSDTVFHPNYLQEFESELEQAADPDKVFFVASRVYAMSKRPVWIRFTNLARSLITAALDTRSGLAPSLTTGDISMTWKLAQAADFCDPKAVGDDINLLYRSIRVTKGQLIMRASLTPVSTGSVKDFQGMWTQEQRWIRNVFTQLPELSCLRNSVPWQHVCLLYLRVFWSSTVDRISILILVWTWVTLRSASLFVLNLLVIYATAGTAVWVHQGRARELQARVGVEQRELHSDSHWQEILAGPIFFSGFQFVSFAVALFHELAGYQQKFHASCTQGC
eukprot:symbB.v1.2.042551.t1/scaffold10349.1/size1746/1